MTIDGIVAMFEDHKKQVEEHHKKGILYGSACVTDLDMMLDEILRRLEKGELVENLLVEMEEEGYEDVLGTFVEETLL